MEKRPQHDRYNAKQQQSSSPCNLRLREGSRIHMYMLRTGTAIAHIEAFHPRVRHNLLNRRAFLWFRFEHLPDERPARPRREVVDRGRTIALLRVGARACTGIGRVQLIRLLGSTPGDLLEVQAVVDDAAGPNIDEASVISWTDVRDGAPVYGMGYLRLPRNCSGAI
jgi:hypothetical protein